MAAGPTFCTIADLKAKEPNILDLAEKGHFNDELAAAAADLVDGMILRHGFEVEPKIVVKTQDDSPKGTRQLRLPCVYKTLEIIFRAAARDEESPYFLKADKYEKKAETWLDRIKFLDLDDNEDGTITDQEKDRLPRIPRFRRT